MSLQGDDLAGITPDILCIPRRNKIKHSDTSIIRKEPIQEPFNPSKSAKEGTLTDVEKSSPKKNLQLFDIR